jgi:hypothetical protein
MAMLNVRLVVSEAEWLALLPDPKPPDLPADQDREGRTIVTLGALGKLALPPGYSQLTALQCCDAMGDPIGDRAENARFLVSGESSPSATFVMAARSGIINLDRRPSHLERLTGASVRPDLRPLAEVLDWVAEDTLLRFVDLDKKGEPGMLVAAWLMLRDKRDTSQDTLAWLAGMERWRYLLQASLPGQILSAAAGWLDNERKWIEIIREAGNMPPEQPGEGEKK